MQKFISFSGGVESTTMCLLFGEKAKAITGDTGWEHPEMYARWEKVERQIRDIHPNFEIIRVKAEKTLPQRIIEKKYYPGIKSRYCTQEFKIEPIDKFLKQQGECELMIGLNADEGDKRTGNYGLVKSVKYTYPLYENGITRSICLMLLKRFGLEPSFPPYMARGGCVGCFFKAKKEFVAMQLLAPEQFAEVEAIEQAIQDKRGKFYGVRENIPSLRKLRQQIESQELLFSVDEIYDLAYQEMQTTCGVFCHR